MLQLRALGQHRYFMCVLDARVLLVKPASNAIDVRFNVRIALDIESDGCAVDKELAVVLHRVVVAVDPRRNGLRYADAHEWVVWVRVFQMEDLVRLERVDLAVEGVLVVRELVWKGVFTD